MRELTGAVAPDVSDLFEPLGAVRVGDWGAPRRAGNASYSTIVTAGAAGTPAKQECCCPRDAVRPTISTSHGASCTLRSVTGPCERQRPSTAAEVPRSCPCGFASGEPSEHNRRRSKGGRALFPPINQRLRARPMICAATGNAIGRGLTHRRR